MYCWRTWNLSWTCCIRVDCFWVQCVLVYCTTQREKTSSATTLKGSFAWIFAILLKQLAWRSICIKYWISKSSILKFPNILPMYLRQHYKYREQLLHNNCYYLKPYLQITLHFQGFSFFLLEAQHYCQCFPKIPHLKHNEQYDFLTNRQTSWTIRYGLAPLWLWLNALTLHFKTSIKTLLPRMFLKQDLKLHLTTVFPLYMHMPTKIYYCQFLWVRCQERGFAHHSTGLHRFEWTLFAISLCKAQ